MNTVAIYCPEITERITYSFDVLLRCLLGVDVRFFTVFEEWDKSELPKLTYSAEPPASGHWIWAHSLLFETGVKSQDIRFQFCDEIPCFFSITEQYRGRSAVDFDPFAAAFYLLSRYEEYLPSAKYDAIGRFEPDQSAAARGNFLHLPVVQHWSLLLKKQLATWFPKLDFKTPDFQTVATFDIDNAFAYKNKGLVRSFGATLRSILKNEQAELVSRFHTLLGEKDPYDSYEVIKEIHEAAGIQPLFFWLVGEQGKYDRNISIDHPAMRKLIKSCAEWTDTGLHPSFASHESGSLVEEKKRLEEVLQHEVTKSRFHYLRFQLPDAYQELIDSGITDDYSMGYAERPGFRAGIAVPFRFYNLKKEEHTTLTIHPFCAMDATYFYHLKHTPERALEDMETLMRKVRETGGNFTLAYHNESLGSKPMWSGWRSAYIQLLERAVNK